MNENAKRRRSLDSFLLYAILEWSNNTLAHAQNSDLRPVSNQFVFTWFRYPTSDRSEQSGPKESGSVDESLEDAGNFGHDAPSKHCKCAQEDFGEETRSKTH